MGPTDVTREQRFTALYREHHPAVLAYARRRTDGDAAADVAAEAFTIAWRRLEDVGDPALPWLLRTARWVLANRDRGERRHDQRLGLLTRARRGWTAWVEPDPAEALTERDRVLAALDALAPEDREVVLLTAWEGLDSRGVGEVLGCSAGAARVRLHRARRRLRHLLVEEDPLPAAQHPHRWTPVIRSEDPS